MLDACRDNPTTPTPAAKGPAVAQRNTPEFRKAFDWSGSINSVTIFSTHGGEPAFESGRDPSVGYFADALARALGGKERRAINSAGEVTVGTLMDYLPDEVNGLVMRDIGREQRPQLLVDTGAKIVLSYPGEATPGSDSGDEARLQFHLPKAALAKADLTVFRNYFRLETSDLDHPIAVPRGKQYVEVKLPDYQSWSRSLDVQPGQEDLNVKLEPKREPMILGLGGAGLGLGAIVAGIAFGAHAQTLSGEVTDLLKTCTPRCDGPTSQAITRKDADGHQAATLSNVFLVSGGVLTAAGAATAAYFYWKRPVLTPETGGGVSLAPGPALAGASLVQTW
jgi:hypothetical protein